MKILKNLIKFIFFEKVANQTPVKWKRIDNLDGTYTWKKIYLMK